MKEAARFKGVSYHTVSRAVRKGKLGAQRSGRMQLIGQEDLEQWHPMRERAPRKYRQREPEPIMPPAVVELASGERIELARRLTSVYEAIHTSAIHQPLDGFLRLLAEQFARAMSFDRVAIWLINEARTEIGHSGSYGQWYRPEDEPEQIVLPYDHQVMYVSKTDVYDGITCWTTPPPINTGPAFSAALVVGQVHLGYIIGDRNGTPFTLTEAQIELGQSLAVQAALTIDLKRTRHREASRTRQLEAVLEQISEPVMVYNADRCITAMSRVARSMYGLPEDLDLAAEPFSLSDLDLGSVHHRGAESINPPSARALAGEVIRNVEFLFVRDDTGEERLLLVDAVPIMEDGVVTTVVAVERDITEQRAVEERERRQREELERSLERTRALAEIPLSLNLGAGLRTVLREASRTLIQLIGGTSGSVGILIDGEHPSGMWSFSLQGLPDELMPMDLREFPGTLRAFEANAPLLNTYESASDRERRNMDGAGTRSNLITPFVIDGTLVGATFVHFRDEHPDISPESITFSSALAAQCVLAIKHARLQRELEAERNAVRTVAAELQQLASELAAAHSSGVSCSPEAQARIHRVLTDVREQASGGS
jgi:excisionase family DNA binding protein